MEKKYIFRIDNTAGYKIFLARRSTQMLISQHREYTALPHSAQQVAIHSPSRFIPVTVMSVKSKYVNDITM
jgi:hypothetical protein